VNEYVSWLVSRVHLLAHRRGLRADRLTDDEREDLIDEALSPPARRTRRQSFVTEFQRDLNQIRHNQKR
jgi:hypothetical protein